MFWIGLIIGLIVGANVSLLLYACIVIGQGSKESKIAPCRILRLPENTGQDVFGQFTRKGI